MKTSRFTDPRLDEIEPYLKNLAYEFDKKGLVGAHKAITVDDLIQVGWEAALIALKSYKEGGDATFTTYAYPQIWRRMTAEVHQFGDTIPIPEYIHWYVIKPVANAAAAFIQKNGVEPTVDDLLMDDELTAYLVSRKETKGSPLRSLISDALEYIGGERIVSLDDDEEELSEELIDTEADSVEDQVDKKMLREAAEEMMTVLSDDEYNVLTRRLGFVGDQMTLREIAAELEISIEGVHRIEKRALDRLRKHPKTRAILRNWN